MTTSSTTSGEPEKPDRKSTRLNSSHSQISYAVFCLKKKNNVSKPSSPVLPSTCHKARELLPRAHSCLQGSSLSKCRQSGAGRSGSSHDPPDPRLSI